MKAIAPILILLVLAQSVLWAQEGRGIITGTVTDASGAVIARAEVRVVNKETGATASTHSNESGNYTIPYLLPGTYDLTAGISGFKKAERQAIEVRVGDVLNIDIPLQVGSQTESVEVSAAAPLLEKATVSIGQVVDQRRLTELPIQAGNAEELIYSYPNLTTVRQPLEKMGEIAARTLLDLIERRETYVPEIAVEPEFIVRKSTARAPHRSPGRRNR